MGIGTSQIIVIFLLILLFFGAKRLPEIARAMGKASLEFKKARDEMLSTAQQNPTTPAEKSVENNGENSIDIEKTADELNKEEKKTV